MWGGHKTANQYGVDEEGQEESPDNYGVINFPLPEMGGGQQDLIVMGNKPHPHKLEF
jgi:hypothetical protein